MLGAAMPPTKVKKATKVATKQGLLSFSVKKNVTSPASRKQQQVIALQRLRKRPPPPSPVKRQRSNPAGTTNSSSSTSLKSKTVDNTSILRLRIPKRLCRILPSVKKFNKREMKQFTKNKPEVKAESLEKQLDEKRSIAELTLGNKRRRGEKLRYKLTQVGEQKFKGMIWDVGVSTTGDLVVSHMDGAVLMDNKFESSTKLENIFLGGGICFLADQRIVVLCRCFDRANIYTPTGSLMKTFQCGKSPQAVTTTAAGNLIITDILNKCLTTYDLEGNVLRTIPTQGNNYRLGWPMYIAPQNGGSEVIVSDCDCQKLFRFNTESGSFLGEFSANTYQGDQVLRPHGLSVSPDGDVMIVDTAVDSIEVFHSTDGSFLQTLLQTEEVSTGMRLKAVSISASGHLAVGCLSGLVRMYKTSMVDAVLPTERVKLDTVLAGTVKVESHHRMSPSKARKRNRKRKKPNVTAPSNAVDLTSRYTAVKRERPFDNSIVNSASQASNNNDNKPVIATTAAADALAEVIVLD